MPQTAIDGKPPAETRQKSQPPITIGEKKHLGLEQAGQAENLGEVAITQQGAPALSVKAEPVETTEAQEHKAEPAIVGGEAAPGADHQIAPQMTRTLETAIIPRPATGSSQRSISERRRVWIP